MAEGSGALRDRYANIMTFDVVESSAGVITFAEVQTNVGIDASRRSGVAILIDEIDYYLTQSQYALLLADNDAIQFGVTISSGVTNLDDFTDRRILHADSVFWSEGGVAASHTIVHGNSKNQFFPPLIMAERQIFLAVLGVSLASVVRLRARVYYRTVQIDANQFVEIAEVFRLVG